MNEQPKPQNGKATVIYLAIWLLFMVLISNPVDAWPGVLWSLFAGGILLLEIGWVAVWIINKIHYGDARQHASDL